MTRLKCAVLDDYQNVALSIADWSDLTGAVDVFSVNRHLEAEALVQAIEHCAMVVIMRERTPFPAELFDRLANLKLLITSGMRNSSIDLAAAQRHGVTVCGTKSFSEPPAELTWALIFALCRNLPIETQNIRNNLWQTTIGKDLMGSTLGLLGLGKIGMQIAGVAQALGVNVIAWSPNLTPKRAALANATLVTKAELFSQSDIVSLHLVLSQRTAGIVTHTDLALMKPDALFVNTSRAGLVDNHALVKVLEAGRIGGAGIDVFDEEPLPGSHSFRTLPNVIATPHLGYVTHRNYAAYYREAVENIEAYLAGAPVRILS
ncbi:D-2-hydroxyacid dehydrogenase family protein [Rhizobium beringeri]|uniref:D-2-hydroxyacid dehydrogenase family protein n=1 Tax=Rhizobium TaxID=379 RepID=UPI003B58C4C0